MSKPATPPAFAYAPRPVRVIDRATIEGFRLKVYSIAAKGDRASDELVGAGRRMAARHLRDAPTRQHHYGVGFLGIHDGRGENQVFLDLWITQNELTHDFWVSSKSDPAVLRRPESDHNSVCVWDLFVQGVEREAWLRHVLNNPAGPDFEAYWRSGFDGRV